MILSDLGSYIRGYKTVMPLDKMLQCGVEGVIFKGAQEQLNISGDGYSGSLSVKQARSAGFRSVGLYYWDSLNVATNILLDWYSKDIDMNNPDWIDTDHEEYDKPDGTHYDPQYISDHGQALCEGLASRYPEKRVIPYTAEWVVYGHSPQMLKWLPAFDSWIAWWSDNLQPRYRLTKEQIAEGWLRRTLYKDAQTGQYVYDMIQEKNQFLSTWPRESNIKVVLHQYSSRILLPYDMVGGTFYDHQNDWNYTYMTIDEWIKYTKGEEMPPAPFEPYYAKITASWLTVTTGPAATYPPVAWLPKDVVINVLEEHVGWGRCSAGWVNLNYVEKVFDVQTCNELQKELDAWNDWYKGAPVS